MDWKPVLGLPLWFWLFVLPSILTVASFIFRERAKAFLRPVWRVLDRLYTASGVVAAGFMIVILLLIVGQMIARWSGVQFAGSTEFAGYAMAATSFFAMAHALAHGAHIRVSIFLNINQFTQLWLNAFAMFIAAITATYFARFAVKTNFLSEMLNDRTQGQDQVPEGILTFVTLLGTWPWSWGDVIAKGGGDWVYTPVWLPQISMSIGTILLAIAIWDHLIRLIIHGESLIQGEGVE